MVVGAGRSGRAAQALCVARGASAVLLDDRPTADAQALEPSRLREADLVVVSPGVPRNHPALREARGRGCVIAEVELASWFIDVPLIGVTGTNGKSTTTALVAHGFELAGQKVFAGGNLGRPLSELAATDEPYDLAVVELSSYQLEAVVDLRLEASTWLNLTPDHLDRYGSVDEYAEAKRRIFEVTRRQCVANWDDRWCRQGAAFASAPVRWHWSGALLEADRPGLARGDDGSARRDDGAVYPLTGPNLLGRHNHENVAAAIELWRAFDLAPADVREAVRTFPGLPHRLERVPTSDERAWYNDSKATNVAAAVVALAAVDGPKLLIVGGRAKAEDKAPLIEAGLRARVVRMLAIGESAADWCRAAEGSIPCDAVGTLEAAVRRARESDATNILFSPACASFDQFRSFEHRGDVFRQLVGAIA